MGKEDNFQSIMQEITNGLTGDYKADYEYLSQKATEYKDSEYGIEIARACGRLIADMLPEDAKEELAKMMEKDEKGHESVLEEVRFNLYKRNTQRAYELLRPLVKDADEFPLFKDDKVSEYRIFNEMFERLLYCHLTEPERDVRKPEFPFSEIYLLYGSTLLELGRIEEAKEALEKSIRWSPTICLNNFEYAETLKLLGDMDGFGAKTKEIFKFAYRPRDIARCYRNMGFYYIEKESYELANGCFGLSLVYENDNKNAMSELYYISSKHPDVKAPEPEKLKDMLEKEGVPYLYDENVIGLALGYGKHMVSEKNYEAALYFFTIANNLIHEEELENLINTIKEEAGIC